MKKLSMSHSDIKLLLYKLISQLNEAKSTRELLLEKYKYDVSSEIKEQLNKLDKLIESVEMQIKSIL